MELILVMHILLCAATLFELQPTIDYLSEKKKAIEALITGVGLTAATYQLTKRVTSQKPSLIIQAGVAGSLDHSLNLSEVVVVESEIIGDLGVFENNSFNDLFHLNLCESNSMPFTNGKLLNQYLEQFSINHLKKVQGVSVNEITTNEQRISYYRKLGAQVESLEGASLHYVGLMEGIPFLQLRSTSNFVGERNKNKWTLKEAIHNLNRELITIIEKTEEI